MENRKLLVSVQTPQETREAIIGGTRILDCEDPRTALGNISPRRIMDVAQAALDAKRSDDIQLSTNIGEDQLLFRRAGTGQAVGKSQLEMAGKAAQSALGVAASLGTCVHPSGIVKVGVDGMTRDDAQKVLNEVVATLRSSDEFSNTQVMAVFFVHDLDLWDERKGETNVRQTLVEVGEFAIPKDPQADVFDVLDADYRSRIRDGNGVVVFQAGSKSPSDSQSSPLQDLVRHRVLPVSSPTSRVRLSEPFSHATLLGTSSALAPRKSNRDVIKAMVDSAADGDVHVDAIMLDTSILMKAAGICLFDTRAEANRDAGGNSPVVDLNRFAGKGTALEQRGILSLADIRFFVEYAHFKGLVANIAGSITSYQAQQLWKLIPDLDQQSTRGAASAVVRDPFTLKPVADTRMSRVIHRALVRGNVPPEQGGVLNLPESIAKDADAQDEILGLVRMLSADRTEKLQVYSVARDGTTTELHLL
jgi:uncharacterized protein (UPF0264 family)